MRIQHNISAMNSYRNYSNNTSAVSKNLEKLSSGYKVNRAGDDAAGLAISQKMRIQITGLEQAQSNAKAGINLVQTAEGALTEVHDMLNRMYTLAEQSANGTYDNTTDRNQLQKEVSQLRTEIDRIADSSNYNGIKLLDGSLKNGGDATIEVTGKISMSASAPTAGSNTLTAALADFTDAAAGDKLSFSMTDTNGKTYTASLTVNNNKELVDDTTGAVYQLATSGGAIGDDEAKAIMKGIVSSMTNGDYKINGDNVESTATGAGAGAINSLVATKTAAGGVVSKLTTAVGDTPQKGAAAKYTFADTAVVATTDKSEDAKNKVFSINGQKFALAGASTGASDLATIQKAVGDDVHLLTADDIDGASSQLATATGLKFSSDGKVDGASGRGLTMQIGDTAENFNRMNVDVKDMHADAMGIGYIDISTQGGAATAMNAIKTATNYVSDVRGTLGALQNRLDHTINNLSVSQENIQEAESTIRDTDVAKEMMAYTKNNILVQSAQAMLAQANQLPQGVLQLLG